MKMEIDVKGRVLAGRHGWTGLGGVHQQRGVCREMNTVGQVMTKRTDTKLELTGGTHRSPGALSPPPGWPHFGT
jgi:hypothetical protein